MEQENESGWRSYVPGAALVLSVAGMLMAGGGLIKDVSYVRDVNERQQVEIDNLETRLAAMDQTLARIDERTARWEQRAGGER